MASALNDPSNVASGDKDRGGEESETLLRTVDDADFPRKQERLALSKIEGAADSQREQELLTRSKTAEYTDPQREWEVQELKRIAEGAKDPKEEENKDPLKVVVGSDNQREEKVHDEFRILPKQSGVCIIHQLAYEFWCTKGMEFYCKKCVTEITLSNSTLRLIEDAMPMIKDSIDKLALEIFHQRDTKQIVDFKKDCSEKLKLIIDFKEIVRMMEEELQEKIKQSEQLHSRKVENLSRFQKMNDELNHMESTPDIASVATCRDFLISLNQTIVLPTLSEFCKAACLSMQETLRTYPSNADSMKKRGKYGENNVLLLPNPKHKLEKGGQWTVKSKTTLSNVLVLDKNIRPRSLELVIPRDEPEPPPEQMVSELAKRMKNCDVMLSFYHSFYRPHHSSADQKLLKMFMDNSSLSILRFFGHLDAEGIANLPKTIQLLGLVISNAAEARAVSDLQTWNNLRYLHVSVSLYLDACILSQLPFVHGSVTLHFPGLRDDQVDSVRPAINSLVGDPALNVISESSEFSTRFYHLSFSMSQLSASGARHLAQQLQNRDISYITVEPKGSWQPGLKERKTIEKEFYRIVKYIGFFWSCNWC